MLRLPTVAAVLAGGQGSRVGLNRPKQLLKVAGKTVLEHTVEALQACAEIDEIVVVMAADFVTDAEQLVLGRADLPKVSCVLAGGTDRNSSSLAAIEYLGERECNVLFHDAVRPLLPPRVVTGCVAALQTYEAVDVAISSADTIIRVDDRDQIVEIPDRSRLRRGQTPQAFRLSTIRRAYELAAADPDFRATDDCGVVLRYLPGVPIQVVPGDEQNMKITFPIDLFLADKLFQLASHLARHNSADELGTLLDGRTIVVFGGSYGIGKDVADLARQVGCEVFSFSRSTTGTHIERPEDVRQALQEVHARTGRIDAVVLTAANLVTGSLVSMSDDDLQAQIGVNFTGPTHVARASYPYLRETGGHLVLFTSSSYTRGRGSYAVYSAAKAGVVNLAQALADEWSEDGIHVNVVNPERTRTPMRVQAFGHEPEGTLLDSAAVAASVLDVVASGLTGQVIDVRRDVSSVPSVVPDQAVGNEIGDISDAEVIAHELAVVTDDAEIAHGDER